MKTLFRGLVMIPTVIGGIILTIFLLPALIYTMIYYKLFVENAKEEANILYYIIGLFTTEILGLFAYSMILERIV